MTISIIQVSTPFNPWPQKILAPYLYVSKASPFDVTSAFQNTAQKHYTLSFVISDQDGNPSWNNETIIDDPFYIQYVRKIRNLGGDVIISIGGAIGKEFAQVTTNVKILTAKYQLVVDTYELTYLDIDIEGPLIDDPVVQDRRSKALVALKKNNPGLMLSYTLPCTPSGLNEKALSVLQSAKTNGLVLDVVNIMAMDYGNVPNGNTAMGTYALSAAESLRKQLIQLQMEKTMIGITPMIGQNDVQAEVFRIEDAAMLLEWAQKTDYVRSLSFWSINRDNGKQNGIKDSSAVAQKDYQYLQILQNWNRRKKFTVPS